MDLTAQAPLGPPQRDFSLTEFQVCFFISVIIMSDLCLHLLNYVPPLILTLNFIPVVDDNVVDTVYSVQVHDPPGIDVMSVCATLHTEDRVSVAINRSLCFRTVTS